MPKSPILCEAVPLESIMLIPHTPSAHKKIKS